MTASKIDGQDEFCREKMAGFFFFGWWGRGGGGGGGC